MKVVQLHCVDPKKVFDPTPTPKLAYQRPKKTKTTSILSQIQMSEFRESQKMKVVQLQKQTPTPFLNRTPTPKIAHQGPTKSPQN